VAIAFNKISIEVKVPSISSESVFFGSILVGSTIAATIETTTNIVEWNDNNRQVTWYSHLAINNLLSQLNRRIHTTRLTWMDGIIDKQNCLVWMRVKVTILRDHDLMEWMS